MLPRRDRPSKRHLPDQRQRLDDADRRSQRIPAGAPGRASRSGRFRARRHLVLHGRRGAARSTRSSPITASSTGSPPSGSISRVVDISASQGHIVRPRSSARSLLRRQPQYFPDRAGFVEDPSGHAERAGPHGRDWLDDRSGSRVRQSRAMYALENTATAGFRRRRRRARAHHRRRSAKRSSAGSISRPR